MPPQNNSTPPEAMSWKKATPLLVIAVLFDLIRAFFAMFWLFGPALAGLACKGLVSDYVGSLGGLTELACAGGSITLGIFGFGFTMAFGTIMAMAVGLIGFGVVGGSIFAKNRRIFKTAPSATFKMFAGLAASETPIVDALPILSFLVWRLYRAQIKKEQAELKKWRQEQVAAQLAARQQAATEFIRLREEQMRSQEAANDARFIEEQDEQEAAYAQEGSRKAA